MTCSDVISQASLPRPMRRVGLLVCLKIGDPNYSKIQLLTIIFQARVAALLYATLSTIFGQTQIDRGSIHR
jgi:hypothetical protein